MTAGNLDKSHASRMSLSLSTPESAQSKRRKAARTKSRRDSESPSARMKWINLSRDICPFPSRKKASEWGSLASCLYKNTVWRTLGSNIIAVKTRSLIAPQAFEDVWNEKPPQKVAGVFERGRNGAPSSKGCVSNGQKSIRQAINEYAPLPFQTEFYVYLTQKTRYEVRGEHYMWLWYTYI